MEAAEVDYATLEGKGHTWTIQMVMVKATPAPIATQGSIFTRLVIFAGFRKHKKTQRSERWGKALYQVHHAELIEQHPQEWVPHVRTLVYL